MQATTAREIERGLAHVYREATDALRDALAGVPGTVSERAARLRLDSDALAALIMRAGITSPVVMPDGTTRPSLAEQVAERQAELAELGAETLQAAGIPRAPSTQQVVAAATAFDDEYFAETIVRPQAAALMEGLRTSILSEDLDVVVSRLAESLDESIPVAVTEARTRIAEFDRAVTATVGAEIEAELWYYSGPVDGITRPFCSELVGHVFSGEQVARLDNGQTDASPLFSGGGYNCRHSWAPVSGAFVEAAGLPMGTDDMVDAANARAQR